MKTKEVRTLNLEPDIASLCVNVAFSWGQLPPSGVGVPVWEVQKPTQEGHKHEHSILQGYPYLTGLHYQGVCMGYPYLIFAYVLFWGLHCLGDRASRLPHP